MAISKYDGKISLAAFDGPPPESPL